MLSNLSRTAAFAAGVLAPVLLLASCGGSDSAVDRSAAASERWVVGLGDSYMSGEGALISNKNYTNKPSNWSFWITGTLAQVFGDKVDGGQQSETIPYCHRSFSAPMHFGEARFKTMNLACSGAKSATFTDGGVYKPGIDFDAGTGGDAQGQAALLEQFARNHDVAAVVLSIGGNDFGFSKVISQAANAYLFPTSWEPWRNNETGEVAIRQENLDRVSAGVTSALVNINQAMTNAGKAPGSYRIVYQSPPQFIGRAGENAYAGSFTYERQDVGGCGINDSTLDWIVDTAAPKLLTAMKKGVADAVPQLNGTQVVFMDGSQAFTGHKLCGKDDQPTGGYPSTIGMEPGQPGSLTTPTQPPWQADNGQANTWVAPLEIFGVQTSGKVIDPLLLQAAGGDPAHLKTLPFHPNYWGQRALAACNSAALDLGATSSEAALLTTCQPSGSTLDSAGRPAMQVSAAQALTP